MKPFEWQWFSLFFFLYCPSWLAARGERHTKRNGTASHQSTNMLHRYFGLSPTRDKKKKRKSIPFHSIPFPCLRPSSGGHFSDRYVGWIISHFYSFPSFYLFIFSSYFLFHSFHLISFFWLHRLDDLTLPTARTVPIPVLYCTVPVLFTW